MTGESNITDADLRQIISDIDEMLNFFAILRKELNYSFMHRLEGEIELKNTKAIMVKYLNLMRKGCNTTKNYFKYISEEARILEKNWVNDIAAWWERAFKKGAFDCVHWNKVLLTEMKKAKNIEELVNCMKTHFASNHLEITVDITNRQHNIWKKRLGNYSSKYLFPNFKHMNRNQYLIIGWNDKSSNNIFGEILRFMTLLKIQNFVIFEKDLLYFLVANHTEYNAEHPTKTVLKSEGKEKISVRELKELLKNHVNTEKFRQEAYDRIVYSTREEIKGPFNNEIKGKPGFLEKVYVVYCDKYTKTYEKTKNFRFKYRDFDFPVFEIGKYNKIKYMVIKHITPNV